MVNDVYDRERLEVDVRNVSRSPLAACYMLSCRSTGVPMVAFQLWSSKSIDPMDELLFVTFDAEKRSVVAGGTDLEHVPSSAEAQDLDLLGESGSTGGMAPQVRICHLCGVPWGAAIGMG